MGRGFGLLGAQLRPGETDRLLTRDRGFHRSASDQLSILDPSAGA